MSPVRPRSGILDIAPYVGGREKVEGTLKQYKLSANETPLGPSPKAREAAMEALGAMERYPDGGALELRKAIAGVYGLDPERIVCGAGSDELLHLLAQAYIGPGDEAIATRHGFLIYPIVTKAAGGEIVQVPEKNLTADVDAILAAQNEKTRIVFLANPNNPTGTYLSFSEIKRLREGLREDVLLVLDAAYAEYVRSNDYESGIELVATHDNVVMTRTFSKVYGLAAIRLGWAYCPASVADVLNRIRGPFNVNVPAMKAGIAAIEDKEHTAKAVAHNEKWRAWLSEEISALGLEVVPSVTNFISFRFPPETGKSAAEADEFLCSKGLILRQIASYGLPDYLRLTVSTEEANLKVVVALKEFLGKA